MLDRKDKSYMKGLRQQKICTKIATSARNETQPSWQDIQGVEVIMIARFCISEFGALIIGLRVQKGGAFFSDSESFIGNSKTYVAITFSD